MPFRLLETVRMFGFEATVGAGTKSNRETGKKPPSMPLSFPNLPEELLEFALQPK